MWVFILFGGVGVPKGTPKEVMDVLKEVFKKAVENGECKKSFEQMGKECINYLRMKLNLGSNPEAISIKIGQSK